MLCLSPPILSPGNATPRARRWSGVCRAVLETAVALLCCIGGPGVAAADPGGGGLRNGGFEADRFEAAPGLAADNGGISAWCVTGRAGINPVYGRADGRAVHRRPILDNGRIPEGRQAVFLKSRATLSQSVSGLAPGRKWLLVYHENASVGPGPDIGPPHLAVLLANRVVIPDHQVRPIDPKNVFRTPFRRIVSAPFASPPDGRARLLFLCSGPQRAGLGIDAVQIIPWTPEAPQPTPIASAGPVVLNGDFEADHYTRPPGYADRNGGIAAWQFKGHVGINPVWNDRVHRWGGRSPFVDNGRAPSGGQVAFIQNVGELRQQLTGFEPGARYRLVYFENGRITRAVPDDPVLEVLLGGKAIVSAHAVPSTGRRRQHRTPYFRVESAVFTAPASGRADLIFRTCKTGGTTVFIDAVRIEKIP